MFMHCCMYRSAFNVSRFLHRVAPLSGRHYRLYLRVVTSFALCNGHVRTDRPTQLFSCSTNIKSTTVY